jgi:acetamidase/formamidase
VVVAIHRFDPTTWQNTFGRHEPVLCIAPGDTVVTTTVDARGVDASGKEVASRPNPQTGPFFIEGAEPGDALVVRFDRIATNRSTGWTSTCLAPNVVDPEFVPSMPDTPRVDWDIDTDAGTVRPSEPMPGLERLAVPLRPMLGSFGVAPKDGQAISTFTSAEHGGNMDYRGFREGVTVYLPVFVEGALFHVGDGHAVQGDGEINGTGVETSMDVEFTVDLRKGWTIGWPRGEDETYIFAAGNARPLDQALQHATTEMTRWLQADYGLDVRAISTLMGQVVEYEIGNVYDPAYTVVCKMPKSILAMLRD